MEFVRKLVIESHGNEHAIYSGRDRDHHGYRLCNVNDFDMNKERTLRTIDAALLALELVFNYINRKDEGRLPSSDAELENIVSRVSEAYFLGSEKTNGN